MNWKIIVDFIVSCLKREPEVTVMIPIDSLATPQTQEKTLQLNRIRKDPTGVYSELLDQDGYRICYTLEHSYQIGSQWDAKLQPGTYKCVKGTHQLHDGVGFQTFEVTGVIGHSGILFHKGNLEKDSEGCLLVGIIMQNDQMVSSGLAFDKFLNLMGDQDFMLEVL
jgi:hypothetical protein